MAYRREQQDAFGSSSNEDHKYEKYFHQRKSAEKKNTRKESKSIEKPVRCLYRNAKAFNGMDQSHTEPSQDVPDTTENPITDFPKPSPYYVTNISNLQRTEPQPYRNLFFSALSTVKQKQPAEQQEEPEKAPEKNVTTTKVRAVSCQANSKISDLVHHQLKDLKENKFIVKQHLQKTLDNLGEHKMQGIFLALNTINTTLSSCLEEKNKNYVLHKGKGSRKANNPNVGVRVWKRHKPTSREQREKKMRDMEDLKDIVTVLEVIYDNVSELTKNQCSPCHPCNKCTQIKNYQSCQSPCHTCCKCCGDGCHNVPVRHCETCCCRKIRQSCGDCNCTATSTKSKIYEKLPTLFATCRLVGTILGATSSIVAVVMFLQNSSKSLEMMWLNSASK